MRHLSGLLGLLCLATLAWASTDDGRVEAGRKVYLAEGCINCHSQYVRPGTADVERWGPSRPLTEMLAQTPPLFGNRRQGPDLQNVGNRRSYEWQRLHLIAPRRVTPGSRMPSYAHLFADGDPRGEALLAYLNSLGGDDAASHVDWAPTKGEIVLDRAAQQRLFAQWCVSCHGESGRGNGALAAQLLLPPRDLVAGRWHYVPAGTSIASERTALARLIKFGVPGTAMAGREYLSDFEVVALVDYVQSLRASQEKIPAQL